MENGSVKYFCLYEIIAVWSASDFDGAWEVTQKQDNLLVRMNMEKKAISSIFLKDPEKGLKIVAKIPSNNQESILKVGLYSWGKANPRAACDYISSKLNLNQQKDILLEIIYYWASTSPNDLGAWLSKQNKALQTDKIKSAMFQGWIKVDPWSAIEQMKKADFDESSELWGLAGYEMGKRDLQKALKGLKIKGDSKAMSAIETGIVNSLSETDPEQAAEYFLSNPDHKLDSSISMIAASLSQIDPKKAVTWISKVKPGQSKNQGIIQIATIWGQTEPVAAKNWLTSILKGNDLQYGLSSIISSWVQRDPVEVKKYLLSIPPGEKRDQSIQTAISVMAEENLEDAIVFCNELPEGASKQEAFNSTISSLSRKSPARALDFLKKIGGAEKYPTAFNDILRQWAMEHPAECLKYVLSLDPNSQQTELVGEISSTWADQDPSTMRDFLPEIKNENLKKKASNSMLLSLSRSEPFEALKWLEKNGIDNFDSYTVEQVFLNLFKENFEEGLKAIKKIIKPNIKNNLYTAIAAQMAESDVQEAIQWSLTIKPDNLKFEVQERILSRWADVDPQNALEWIKSQPKPIPQPLCNVFCRSLGSWVERSPEAALAFVNNFEKEDSKNNLLEYVIPLISKYDISKANRLIEKLPSSESKSHAKIEMLDELATVDPQKAASLILELKSAKEQEEAIGSVMRHWKRSDIQSAVAWMLGQQDLDIREKTFFQIGSDWAEVDPKAASSLIKTLKDSDQRRMQSLSIGVTWARKNFFEAYRWALTDVPKDIQEEVRKHILNGIGSENASLIFDSIKNQNLTPDQKKEIMDQALEFISLDDPFLAADEVVKLSSEDQNKLNLKNIAQRLLHKDFNRGEKWIESLKDSPAKESAITLYITELSQKDPNKGASVFEKQTSHNIRYQSLSSVASDQANKSIPDALNWVTHLQNQEEKLHAYGSILSVWVARGYAEPANWMLTNPQLNLSFHERDILFSSPWRFEDADLAQKILKLYDRNPAFHLQLSKVVVWWMGKYGEGFDKWLDSFNLTPEEREKVLSKAKEIKSYQEHDNRRNR